MEGSIWNSSTDGENLAGFLRSFKRLRARGDDTIIHALNFHLSNGNPEGDDLEYVGRLLNAPEVSSPKLGLLKQFLTEEFNSYNSSDKGQTLDVQERLPVSRDLGGIDLDPAMLNLKVEQHGRKDFLLLTSDQVENFHINGLVPVIIDVMPINDLSAVLGVK
jgi:hypothetical protein